MYVIEDVPVYFVDGDCAFDASPIRLSTYNDWCVYVCVSSAYSNARHTDLVSVFLYVTSAQWPTATWILLSTQRIRL